MPKLHKSNEGHNYLHRGAMNRAVPEPEPQTRPWDLEVFPVSRLHVAHRSSVRETTLSLSLGNRLCVCWSGQVLRKNRNVLTFYINRLARVSRFFPSCCCCPPISAAGSGLHGLFLSIHPPVRHKFERPVLTTETRVLPISMPHQLIF